MQNSSACTTPAVVLPVPGWLACCTHTGPTARPHIGPAHWNPTYTGTSTRAHRLPRMPPSHLGRCSTVWPCNVNSVAGSEAVLCPLFCAHLPWDPRCRVGYAGYSTTFLAGVPNFQGCQGQPWHTRTPSRPWSPISLWVSRPPKAYPNLSPWTFHNPQVPPRRPSTHSMQVRRAV